MPLKLTRKPVRISGVVNVTCPFCGHQQTSEEISLPPRSVAMTNLHFKNVVLAPNPKSLDGTGFIAELVFDCPKCKIPTKQFFPVVEESEKEPGQVF